MSENIRFFKIVEALKEQKLLTDYVQLAQILETNKAGISDIKKGRKKLSIETLRSMKKSYPQISIEYIVMGDGDMFVTPISHAVQEDVISDSPIIDKLFVTIEKKDAKIEELLKENARLEERLRLVEHDTDFGDSAETPASTESSLLQNIPVTSAGARLKE